MMAESHPSPMELQTTLLSTFLFTLLCFLCFKFWSCLPIFTNWPVLGMLPTFLSNLPCILDTVTQVLQQNNGTFAFKGPWFCGFDYLITSDAMNVHHILNKNHSNYHKGPEFKQIMEPFGDGIFVANSDWWRLQKTILHSLITNEKFAMSVERTMHDKIANSLFVNLDDVLQYKTEIDLQDVLQRFTFDVMCKLVLGFDPDPRTSIEFTELAQAVAKAFLFRHAVPGSFWRALKWFQIGIEKEMKQAVETFDQFIYECISEKRHQVSKRRELNRIDTHEKGFDLITCFLVDYEENNSNIQGLKDSDKFVRDTVFSLLAAGKETTAAALSWFLWLVVTHPSIEEKILEEMKTNMQPQEGKKFNGIFDGKKLNDLVYLHKTVCEALRLYPSLPYNHVVSVDKDTLPSGHHINKNTRVLYSPYAMGRMETIWGKDCMEFKPERWDSENDKIKHIPSYIFSAFNAGPRTCLGKSLALQEMKTIGAAVLWNYKLKLVENYPVYPRSSIILHMKYGLKVTVSRRDVSME